MKYRALLQAEQAAAGNACFGDVYLACAALPATLEILLELPRGE